MSYNGAGTFNINSSGQPVVTATTISSTAFNALTADLATGLSTAICKDGQTATTARIPFIFGINSSLTTDATSISTGSILTAGGIGCTKALWVGGLANIAGAATLQSTLAVSGQVILNNSGSALATNATSGFTFLPSCAGTPTGVPASTPTGASPFVFDSTNSIFYVYNSGWKAVTMAVKSIQQGTIAMSTETSKTATITSVNTAKAFVLYLGGIGAFTIVAGSGGIDPAPYLQLTNATTVTAARPSATQTQAVTVGFMVVEFT